MYWLLHRRLIRRPVHLFVLLSLLILVLGTGGEAFAQVDRVVLAGVDKASLAAEDAAREAAGEPARFALPADLGLVPADRGTWDRLPDGRHRWRLEVSSPGCLSLNFGFPRFRLPWEGRLELMAADGSGPVLRYTTADMDRHGQLWTPVLVTDAVLITLILPEDRRWDFDLEVGRVGRGYRFFGEPRAVKTGTPGSCNIDVVCAEGDDWREDIGAVGVYTVNGSWTCTGAMVNNTNQDGRPFFLTAFHCGVTDDTNAASIVIYWNYESENCGDLGGVVPDPAQSQGGALHRASYFFSDCTLIELDDPPDPAWGVTFAGWDRRNRAPGAAIAIHHPDTGVKCISFEDDSLSIATYLQDDSPGNGSHLRVEDWDAGTTEPGSSGSPLFDRDHRVVGQLHGGQAACGNDLADWYGRLFVSWEGGGTDGTRLRDWLDPIGTGSETVDLYDPNAAGIRVTPSSGFAASGSVGGPFVPGSVVYTVANQGSTPLQFTASSEDGWVAVIGGSGTITVGGSAEVTVQLGPAAANLPEGIHRTTVVFTNHTDDLGSTQRPVRVEIGERARQVLEDLDTRPDWDWSVPWAYGQPQGLGGDSYGGPDPTSGATGTNVLGTNLAGDYAPDIDPPVYLTAGPFDLSGRTEVELRFQRWLNVEATPFDQATVEISTDAGGVDYASVWTSTGEVTDTAWQAMVYDISAWADDQSEVRIRFGLQTDSTWEYSGWNVDDIELWAFGEAPEPPGPEDTLALAGLWPNPGRGDGANLVVFTLPSAGRAKLEVFDLKGRRVALIADESFPAGENQVPWGGRDDSGRRLAAGVYVVRLEAGGTQIFRKLTLLH